MRFASLGSGSSGNATIIDSGQTTIMLDCGFACKETVRRLSQINIVPEQISAIVVTHEHNDHSSGVGVFSRKYKVPVYMNYGTAQQKDLGALHQCHIFDSFQSFQINDIHLKPLIVPHDSREAVQFVFQHQHKRLAILTDLGHVSGYILESLKKLDALVIESNHCPQMLQQGSYRAALKKRVGGDYGHLNNYQAAELIKQIDLTGCQHVIAAHLSRENNHPEKAISAFQKVLSKLPNGFEVACQDKGYSWKDIH